MSDEARTKALDFAIRARALHELSEIIDAAERFYEFLSGRKRSDVAKSELKPGEFEVAVGPDKDAGQHEGA